MTVLDRFAEKLERLRRRYEDSDRLCHGHGFITEEPLNETEIHQIEENHHVTLPDEYRAFVARFGDGDVGPCNFNRLRDAITEDSGLPFPLSRPFLGGVRRTRTG
jgi:SMI1 / KNR4 family (SUKH-1)